jgi:hypothetical protein
MTLDGWESSQDLPNLGLTRPFIPDVRASIIFSSFRRAQDEPTPIN